VFGPVHDAKLLVEEAYRRPDVVRYTRKLEAVFMFVETEGSGPGLAQAALDWIVEVAAQLDPPFVLRRRSTLKFDPFFYCHATMIVVPGPAAMHGARLVAVPSLSRAAAFQVALLLAKLR
jgi:hypothetical protein